MRLQAHKEQAVEIEFKEARMKLSMILVAGALSLVPMAAAIADETFTTTTRTYRTDIMPGDMMYGYEPTIIEREAPVMVPTIVQPSAVYVRERYRHHHMIHVGVPGVGVNVF